MSLLNRPSVWLLLLSLVLSACAGMQSGGHRPLENIRLQEEHKADIPVAKALYDPAAASIYILNNQSRQVNIIQDSRLINTIGGMGFERGNILRLTDIACGEDGTLLVLDSADRSVKRFSNDGAYVSEIALDWIAQPELLCQGPDQTHYIYDSSGGEIICLSALDNQELFRFGKFQLQLITALSCSRDYVSAYSSVTDKSTIYSSLGQLIREVDGYWLSDNYRNVLSLSSRAGAEYNMISRTPEAQDDWPLISGKQPVSMAILGSYLCVAEQDRVLIYKLNYQVAP